MAAPRRSFSCESATQTLEWMNAIAVFLRPFKPLLDAHVVNFFKDRLWEMVDEQWMECLRKESVENLLKLPSGFVQDYWPHSLQEFICTLRSLVFAREPKLSHPFLCNLHVASLGSVLTQGMSLKKKHEVEILAAVISKVASGSGAQTIIDVGSGQGYLAQALSFEYQLSVTAIDASLHHATVTNARAERIKKHYAAKIAGSQHLKVPRTVTCHVLSSDILTALSTVSLHEENVEQSTDTNNSLENDVLENLKSHIGKASYLYNNRKIGPPLVLAGLHACGDLSVNMLRTFVDCEQVKAVVGVGCCYNLLSEDHAEKTNTPCGFPMSRAAKLSGLTLGKNAHDLACQSAERWRSLTKDDALQNFDVHTFRAAFQMVLDKYFPDVLTSSPSIGRKGKALRRQRMRQVIESKLGTKGCNTVPFFTFKQQCKSAAGSLTMKTDELEVVDGCYSNMALRAFLIYAAVDACTTLEELPQSSSSSDVRCLETTVEKTDNYLLFKEFSMSGLSRLGCGPSEDINLLEIWKEAQPFAI
ncbi:methyltransferase-like protein 25 isoform X3 [Phoenix dactylifera]|uniref:Methyltransferase-like protein 25 isoform X3 n=1 Tax=Phoenix dactylifera TaxID=42345 RepID=A0A8B8ZEL8_PHODC|nr:methyltransferase-like protein 25 isoform X3 [Phoenix dactylifera]